MSVMLGRVQQDRIGHKAFLPKAKDIPALNREIFDSLSHVLDKALLGQIYCDFLAQTRLRADTLAQSADCAAVQATAHTIKGTAGMLGATYIAAVAEQLENDPVTGSDLSAALAELMQDCTALEAALRKSGCLDEQ